MKLAPPQNTLQPLPPDVQAAVSENIQRSASPTDMQNAQVSQRSQNLTPGQTVGQPATVGPIALPSGVGTFFPWVVVVIVIAVIAAGFWFWRSF